MGKSGNGPGLITMEDKLRDLTDAINSGSLTLTKKPEFAARTGTLEYPDFTPFVNAGAAWLDEHTPGWDLKIDVDDLDLDDHNSCVLGQTWNHYADSLAVADAQDGDLADKTNYSVMVINVTHELTAGEDMERRDAIRVTWAGDHGFALTEPAYRWAHVEARRRIGLAESEDVEIPEESWTDFAAMTWTIDAELWEQLTASWLVLIRARQDAVAGV